METNIIKNLCPVCGEHVFTYANSYEICPICDWENCEYQFIHRDEDVGPNGISLDNYIKEWNKKKQAEIA